jgi:tetratricopeptide (TPR) repeat protein
MMAIYPGWRPGRGAYAGLLAWVLVAVLALVLARRGKAARAALLGLGWFVLNLAPVLGFIPMSFQHLAPVADHLAYLSLVAVAGVAAAGLGLIRSRLAPGLIAAAVAAVLAVESHAYARTFTSQEAMWTANAARNPGSAAVQGNLGFVLHAAGKLDRSVESYQRAAQLDPDDGQIEDELAGVLAEANRGPEANAHLGKAIAAYERELQSYPWLHDAHGRLGIALAAAGRSAEAAVELEKALSLDPGSFKAQNNLANVLINLPGRLPEAVTHLEAAARINPGSLMVQLNLGYALLADGRPAEAVGHYRAALGLDPGNTDAHNNLGYALAQLGRFTEARAEFEAALRLRPGDADARANLARLPRGEGR